MQFKSVWGSSGAPVRLRSVGVYVLLAGWLLGTGYALWVLSPTNPARLDVCRAAAPR